MPHTQRYFILHQWLNSHTGFEQAQIEPASSDASFRRYFRTHDRFGHSYILMDAPPTHEDVRPFLAVGKILRDGGVLSPRVYASDIENGFLLLEDFGKRSLLDALQTMQSQHYYNSALDTLLRMHCCQTDGLPVYDDIRLQQEMQLFPVWYLEHQRSITPTGIESRVLVNAFDYIAQQCVAQPQVFVHRDYHSRNLMLTPQEQLGVIDFQDAVRGPSSYDLISLWRDSYHDVGEVAFWEWVELYYQQAKPMGLVDASWDKFRLQVNLMSAQRHLKVMGIFARLYHRDGKSGYLKDLPLTARYLDRATVDVSPLADLRLYLSDIGVFDVTTQATGTA